jgi:hypothetical protein
MKKMGKGVCLYYKITSVTLYSVSVLEGAVGPGVTNRICVLPIFARPNKVQLSIGAVKVM